MKIEWTVSEFDKVPAREIGIKIRALYDILEPELRPTTINVVRTGIGSGVLICLLDLGLPAVQATEIGLKSTACFGTKGE